ncbi:uncharacterized protein BDR25DRAFT_349431 [Lindgomyces ingoldianus]|uniref:Uncharacterized protein n=1 Tax=Lindgomyces ingoldianus TaxID=673940 RepID=A0ACB6RCU4_9PLEO|nr:uncharacterized protein BDR25DRAFT_349431 [Lindgomyces ingoldianus]KAF2476337.1 hypothetical protein BDR25DRAFT_349431 [Lindgomyces ingoldianus]
MVVYTTPPYRSNFTCTPTMFRDTSPTFGTTNFSSVHAPPSPPFLPYNDPLDDIYGSAPSSPILSSHYPLNDSGTGSHTYEILSDLPSRQRVLDTDAYREGLSNSKGQYVQEGFDEGFSLGAHLGQRVGYILGVLQGFVTALRGHDEVCWQEARSVWEGAQMELAIQELLGKKWVDEEGIWKWEVQGKEDEVSLREVVDQHPVVKRWLDKVKEISGKWGADLDTLEEQEHDAADLRS